MPAAEGGAHAAVVGTWRLRIAAPLGAQHVELVLTEAAERLEGVARSRAETVPLRDVVHDGRRLTWSQSITRPMRLHLRFDVTLDGDELRGTSTAGRLPSSAVRGTRAVAGVPPGDWASS